MKATNFDRYLKEQLADLSFARRFEAGRAGMGCGVADRSTPSASRGSPRRNWRAA